MKKIFILLIFSLIYNKVNANIVTINSFKKLSSREILSLKQNRLLPEGTYSSNKYILLFTLSGNSYRLITRDIYNDGEKEPPLYNYLKEENKETCEEVEQSILEKISEHSMFYTINNNSDIPLKIEQVLDPQQLEIND